MTNDTRLTIERIKELREMHEQDDFGEPHVLEVLDAYEVGIQRETKLREALLEIRFYAKLGGGKDMIAKNVSRCLKVAEQALGSEYSAEIEK